MRTLDNPGRDQWCSLTRRPVSSQKELRGLVQEIFSEVETSGDRAVAKYTRKFDGIAPQNVQVGQDEISGAAAAIEPQLRAAIDLAVKNITRFHQPAGPEEAIETAPGVLCWKERRPIEKVGLYIPGGSAPLFSTVLMLGIPANIAGCKEVIVCTPPDREGNIDPAILYCAQLCGITRIYKVGGIQAIAAMTFGTQQISGVYKIFGPGNQYVTAAKQVATEYGMAIDMPAGPSELLVIADDSADPVFIASDLLSQAEHGADSQVVLISLSRGLSSEVKREIASQLDSLPRKEIARSALDHALFLDIDSPSDALDFTNQYAPEHCIISTQEPDFFIRGIGSAGSVFIGNYAPESAGDYASGTNHTLPTNGYARQYSGISLESFTKTITFQQITEQGIRNIGPAIEQMAEAEGLHAHKRAVSLRLEKLKRERQ